MHTFDEIEQAMRIDEEWSEPAEKRDGKIKTAAQFLLKL